MGPLEEGMHRPGKTVGVSLQPREWLGSRPCVPLTCCVTSSKSRHLTGPLSTCVAAASRSPTPGVPEMAESVAGPAFSLPMSSMERDSRGKGSLGL